MGTLIRNIKNSIDDKSSMSVNSITLLVSALMGVAFGFIICFVLVYDVLFDGKVDTDLNDLGIFLLCSGGYIMGSGIPKAYVDSRMKRRSWIEGERMRIEGEEDLKDIRAERRKRRIDEYGEDVIDGDDFGAEDDDSIIEK